jgi:hypothetical protein
MKAYQKDYIELKPLSSKVLDYSKGLKKDIVFRPGVNPFSYLLLIFNDIKTKYSIDTDEILMLFYLNELGVFVKEINLSPENKTNINRFIRRNLIEVDHSIKQKELYKLSEIGFKVILEITDAINDVDKFTLYNRELTLDIHTKAKKIIKNITF